MAHRIHTISCSYCQGRPTTTTWEIFINHILKLIGFPGRSDSKKSETLVWSWVRKIPWRKEWLPTTIFLPGEFHGQRSLVGYNPWECKEFDMTERLIKLTKERVNDSPKGLTANRTCIPTQEFWLQVKGSFCYPTAASVSPQLSPL